MAFHEEVFPFSLQYGMSISIKYKTSVVQTQSLHEERLCSWLDPIRSYTIVPVIFDTEHFQTLGAFFRARSGRTHAFRLHDPIDHELVNQSIGAGDGVRTIWQVYKSYTSGIDGDTYTAKRPLMKLVAPITVTVNDVVVDPGDYTISLTTGLITFNTAPPLNELVKVSCLFHTPVRFSSNRLGTNHSTFQAYNPSGVVLMEDRLPMELLTNSNIIEGDIPGFVEACYPFHTQLSDESEFASRYSDQVISFDSGFEQRTRRSAQGYNDYEFKYEVKPLTEIQRLVSFFHCRKGKYGGFRLRDINDYYAFRQPLGVGDGSTYEFQMQKTYASGYESELRTITKPVEGTIILYADESVLNLSVEHISIDYATGKVLYFLGTINLTFDGSLKTLTRTSGSWVTDGLTIGDKLFLVGSTLNDGLFTVSAVTTLALEVVETVTDESFPLVSLYLPPLPGLELTWTGDFDVATRFNTDELQISINGFESYNGDNLGFQEIHTEPLEMIYNERPAFTSGPLICAGAASAILSAPDIAVVNPVFQLSYSNRGGGDTEIHSTFKGISAWTFFAVISHSQRGVFFEVPQPTVGSPGWPVSDSDSIYPRMNSTSLGTRVFIRNKPTNKAVLIIEGWNGSNEMYIGTDFYGKPVCRISPAGNLVHSGELDVPLYICPEDIVYEPMTVVIISFSYLSSRAYVSGTAAGVVQVGQTAPPFVQYTCKMDDIGTLYIDTVPTDRYVGASLPGTLFYGSIYGAFTANIVGHVPVWGGPLGRVYETYWGQYYKSLTVETEVLAFKQIHNYLIRYLEAKYLYRKKAALALEGTRGHWIATRDTLLKYRDYEGDFPHLNTTYQPVTDADIGVSGAVARWDPDFETGSLHMVSHSTQTMHPAFGATIVAVNPDSDYLQEPLKAWWD